VTGGGNLVLVGVLQRKVDELQNDMETGMGNSEAEEALNKALGNPIAFESSENATKIKRNLIIISVVVIFLILGEITASDKVSLFGVSLEGVTPEKLMTGLGVFLIYNQLHYAWFCYDLFGEWAVRITGTRAAYTTVGVFGSEGLDYSSDPKQSTLYNWWKHERVRMNTLRNLAERSEQLNIYLEGARRPIADSDRGKYNQVFNLADNYLHAQLNEIKQNIDEVNRRLDEPRINVSLKRFDDRFQLLLRSQNLRVLVTELLFPNLLSLYALALLYAFFSQ